MLETECRRPAAAPWRPLQVTTVTDAKLGGNEEEEEDIVKYHPTRYLLVPRDKQ